MRRGMIVGILAALGAYYYRWHIVGRLFGLPPVKYRVGVERDIPVTMPDGVTLMTDHYYPKVEGKFPTILMRSVYGRGKDAAFPLDVVTQFLCQVGAERGYHVISQTTRGRFDSGGEFEPFIDARPDGLATLEWISQQPWFDGSVGMVGVSYGGYVQWAVAADAPPYLKALAPAIITSRIPSTVFSDGAYSLDTALRWIRMLNVMETKGEESFWTIFWQLSSEGMAADLTPAFRHLPLIEADVPAFGKEAGYYRTWLERPDTDDPRWQIINYSDAPAKVIMPVHLIGGWYDMFLRGLLQDYAAMRAAGRQPYLTIGPWSHTSLPGFIVMMRESLIWMDAHLKGDKSRLRRKPVRVYIMGANEWREMEDWPPPSRERRYYLHSRRWLSPDAPEADAPPDHYMYDPANPTPALGGPLMMNPCGPVENRTLEARPDVLTYTTPALEIDMEIMGEVKLELYFRSSVAYTDFFARLCEMDQDGRSTNICDGLLRVEPGKGEIQADGSLRIEVDMWSTAHRFRRGLRIRLQLSSGAHPRWSRNLGTGESIAWGMRMMCAEQTIYHDSVHPSALVLPITEG